MEEERIRSYKEAQKRLDGAIIALELTDDDGTYAHLIDILQDANTDLYVLLSRLKEEEPMEEERMRRYREEQKRLDGAIIALELTDDDGTYAHLIDILQDANIALRVLLIEELGRVTDALNRKFEKLKEMKKEAEHEQNP